jgi:cyclophilin family peptidyl-prolyl cis-trans isomerase
MLPSHEWHAAARAGDLYLLKQMYAAADSPCNMQPAQVRCQNLVHDRLEPSRRTACHHLAADGHVAALQWLLTLPHADLHMDVDTSGATPLHLAAESGHVSCVKALVALGADPTARDAAGRTPFARAAAGAHAEAAHALREASHKLSAPPPHAFLTLSISGHGRVGSLIFALDEANAPRACANFLGLCEGVRVRVRVPGALYGRDGALAPERSTFCGYRGTSFHRLQPGQLIQGGRLASGDLTIFGTSHFDDERGGLAAAQDARGCLCMANAGPDSNASQFYITLAPCPHLSGSHVCFGRLVSGAATLGALDRVACAAGSDAPSAAVTITACGVWPPSSAQTASASGGGGSSEPVASLSEVGAAAESNRAAVATSVAAALRRDEEAGAGKRPRDEPAAEAARKDTRTAVLARWDALGGLSGLAGSDDDEDGESSDGADDAEGAV